MDFTNKKGQGAIEYLLIISAAILVVTVVVSSIVGVVQSGQESTESSSNAGLSSIDKLKCTKDINAFGVDEESNYVCCNQTFSSDLKKCPEVEGTTTYFNLSGDNNNGHFPIWNTTTNDWDTSNGITLKNNTICFGNTTPCDNNITNDGTNLIFNG